jgi:glutaredoxin
MRRFPLVLLCLLLPGIVAAQQPQQQMYRYVDKNGRVVYTDTTPPPDARNVQQKKLGGNYIETSEPPYALQIAQQRNPVTLYSGNCGPLCDSSRALLNRRGVPFREVDPSQPGEAAKLKQLTGDMQVPVLSIGAAQVLKGFEEEKWQSALDQAGYPKTPAARITQLKREPIDKGTAKAASKAGAKTQDAADAKADPKVGEAAPKDELKADAAAAGAPGGQPVRKY